MNLHTEPIATLLDRVAALDDAPDRTRHEWFYADLARLAADAVDDYITHELSDDLAAEQRQDTYHQGHDAGYRRGWDDAHRRTRPAATAGTGVHRTADHAAATTTRRHGRTRHRGTA